MTHQTAAQAHAASLANVQALLSVIQTAAGSKFGHSGKLDWAHVGSVVHIEELLSRIVVEHNLKA